MARSHSELLRALPVALKQHAARRGGNTAYEDALERSGACVDVLACDVTDRARLTDVVAQYAAALTTVVHAAGVLDDGILEALTPERLEVVLRPKADAACSTPSPTTAPPSAYRRCPSPGARGAGTTEWRPREPAASAGRRWRERTGQTGRAGCCGRCLPPGRWTCSTPPWPRTALCSRRS
ncbi:KR domain-containing protein [Streptomyces luteoverticillatus]|uniref:KR domain-containing protein n=1 Tax=Streptomyces luteoverticillatus TaxID=66425 RepID=A0A3Q9G3J9_STRLT|nr:KR domain-containing protein [Streptomyces luteoverticillatus]AZQ75122.1 KR domain-containing protein [Streptomyces luteoverticillatus]